MSSSNEGSVPLSLDDAVTASSRGPKLTIDRLFDPPSLSGSPILGLKISPDGRRVTYLRGKFNNKDQLDLWEYDVDEGTSRLLIDASSLSSASEMLSEEDRERRERQRTIALSGILEYSFSALSDALLFSVNGTIYHYTIGRPTVEAIDTQGYSTDATISPSGGYVAYIRQQNLYVYDATAKTSTALTTDGGGAIKNGMAEFVAQEEMDRSTGYWWAPDDRHIAFTRVDETPVPPIERFEITAESFARFDQRYPAAGGNNVSIQLGVVAVGGGKVTWIELGADHDIYLARVDWLPDSSTLAIQRESRDQRRLDLLFADVTTGQSRNILTETSDSWIELHQELSFLQGSREFIWASSRDGFRHLYLYDYSGCLLRRLTGGNWMVDDFRARAIKCIDEKRRLIYFSATEKSPLERHLYCVSIDNIDPDSVHRISTEEGVHSISVSPDARFYIDNFSSRSHPPRVSVHSMDGVLRHWLEENRLDASHPYAPYAEENSTPEFGTLNAADGQILHYRIFKPYNFDPRRRHPAVVDVYGGPGAQRVLDNWSGNSFIQILTRAGYVVFQLDNRGSAFRGTSFQSPIRGKLGDVEVADQVQGALWLASQNFIAPTRLGIWGWSYGGYTTLMLMLKAPEIFRAGVAGAPVTDWALYDSHYTERYLGRPQDNPDGYAASSVLPHVQNLRGRLLLMHGMADDNVLFLHSTKLFRRLQDLGKQFDVMVYPGGKHSLTRLDDGRHAYATILRFFDANLAR